MKKSNLILGVSAALLAVTATSCMGAMLDISDGPYDYVSGPVFAPDPIYAPGPVFGPAPIGPLYSPLPPSRPVFYPGPGPVIRPNRPVATRPTRPVVTPNRPVTLPDNVPVYTNGGINGNRGENHTSNGQRPGANTRR
ncbi:MAG: hypothetical protein K2H59_02725 [Muribaculaceae bacterium]|nr:hypothetical protein [Muribaculaceae bacterium]